MFLSTLVSLLFSCAEENPQGKPDRDSEGDTSSTGNTPPSAPGVAITPSAPGVDEDLHCEVSQPSVDVDGDDISYTFAWLKDGANSGWTEPDLPERLTFYEEVWTCVVTPSDGSAEGPSGEAIVTLPDDPCGTLVTWQGSLDLVGLGGEDELATLCNDYNSVNGDVTISDFQLMSGDPCLCEITGSLTITDSPYLTEIASLSELRTVGGDLDVAGLTALASVDLGHLGQVQGGFSLTELATLNDVETKQLNFVGGDLNVTECAALSDLEFPALTAVGGVATISDDAGLGVLSLPVLVTAGSINVHNCMGLGELSLPALRELTGNVNIGPTEDPSAGLDITGCDALAGIDLSSLVSVDGDIVVNGTESLIELELPALASVSGEVGVSSNAALQTVRIFASGVVDGTVTVEDNISLVDVVLGLREHGGRIQITANDAMRSLSFPDLVSLDYELMVGSLGSWSGGSAVQVYGSPSLEEVSMPALLQLGSLFVHDNTVLSSMEALGLTSVGDVDIRSNPTLTDLDLGSLEEVENNLYVFDNPSLAHPDGLGSLAVVGGTLTLSNNAGLTDVDGLGSLEEVTVLFVDDCDALTNLDGLDGLRVAAEGLRISNNDALTRIGGLSSVTSMGSLYIDENPALSDISSLTSLSAAGSSVVIIYNDSLVSLDGLTGMRTIGGSLYIEYNAELADITGLYGVTSVYGSLLVIDNPALPTSQAEGLAEAIGEENIGGVTISGNGSG